MGAQNEFFLARQAILDRQRNLVAYELLYRGAGKTPAGVSDDALATARLVQHAFSDIGVATVLGKCRGFINVDAELLLSQRIEALPNAHVVIELLETIEIDDRIVRRCRELKGKGYRLALDDFCAYGAQYEALLDLVDIVKVDVLQLDQPALAALVRRLKLHRPRLLAEKVDSLERARQCFALGFDLFQGFFFAKPAVLQP